MKDREKFYIIEKKIDLVAKAGYRCTRCGQDPGYELLELAHRIRQSKSETKEFIRKYVLETYNEELSIKDCEAILHHEKNLAVSCPKCNSSFNLYNKPEQAKKLVREICNKIYGWSEEV